MKITISTRYEVGVRVSAESSALERAETTAKNTDTTVLAQCSYWDRMGATLLMVPENADRMVKGLEEAGYPSSIRPVLLIGPLDTPARAASLGAELAGARIRVEYSYASESENGDYYLVFRTTDNQRAQEILQAKVSEEAGTLTAWANAWKGAGLPA